MSQLRHTLSPTLIFYSPYAKSPGEGDGYTLQYPCLRKPMDRGA